MPTAVLTSKGQTTIPLKIRIYLGLHTGDKLNFLINKEGKVIITPLTLEATAIKGALRKPNKKVSIEAMRKAIVKRGTSRCKG
jgi:antitoxin PrlF